MFTTIGPKLYEVSQEYLNKQGYVIAPNVEFIDTDFEYKCDLDQMINFRSLTKAMTENNTRNTLLCTTIMKNTDKDSYVLVLGDYIQHLDMLYDFFKEHFKCAFINAKTKKQEREKALRKMRNKEIQILFATYQLAKEGLDIPPLNKLHFITPKRDKVIIQQSAGRGMRPADGKTECRIFDYYDKNIKTCIYQAKERMKVYKVLGCSILGGPNYIPRGTSKDKEKDMLETLNNAF
jgi:superfamily II DNA or RNA helicase